MPLWSQQLRSIRPGTKTACGLGFGQLPSIGASRSRDGRPALEALFRADWERSRPKVAPESGTHRRELPARPDRGRAHPGAPRAGGSAYSPGCSVRLSDRHSIGDGASNHDGRRQPDGMLIEVRVHSLAALGKRPLLSSESVIKTSWPKHEAKATGWSSIRG